MDAHELANYTDDMLMDLIRQDKHFAFNELYRRHWEKMLNIAYKRLKSADVAEELVQEAFLNLYLKRKTLVITTSIAAYLHTVLKYKVLDEVRAQLVRNNYREEWLNRPEVVSDDVHTMLEHKELSTLMLNMADQLAPKCKEVFLLRYKEQLSIKMIAEQLQISEKTVEGHISVARKTLKGLLKDYRADFLSALIFLSLLR